MELQIGLEGSLPRALTQLHKTQTFFFFFLIVNIIKQPLRKLRKLKMCKVLQSLMISSSKMNAIISLALFLVFVFLFENLSLQLVTFVPDSYLCIL